MKKIDINIKGAIINSSVKWVYDMFQMEASCPCDVEKSIKSAKGDDIHVYINSSGGDIGAGAEIYSLLESYKGNVYIHIVGYCCSAASVIACAGYCDMVRVGMYMYHNVSSSASGDYNAMDKQSQVLRTANRAICSAYVKKTGKTEQELLEQMNAETWLTAEDAVKMGFVDKIAENKNLNLVAGFSTTIPTQIIDYMRNSQLNQKKAQLKVELDILKLKEINTYEK